MNRWIKGAQVFGNALAGQPERVPVLAQMHDHAMFLAGLPASRFYTDPVALIEVELLATEYYDFDVPFLFWDVYNIEAEAIGQKLKFHPRSMPDIDQTTPLVKNESDLDKVKLLNPGQAGRMPQVLESYALHLKYSGLPPVLQLCAPFSLACSIRSYTGLISDIKSRPDFAHELLRRICDDVLLPWLKVQYDAVPSTTSVQGADAWASPPNVNLRIFEEFVEPYIYRLDEKFANPNCRVGGVAYWGESYLKNPVDFIEAKVRVSKNAPLGLLCLDPDVERIGVQAPKEVATKHSVPLILGINALLIRSGPIEAIIQRIKEYIAQGAPGGKLAIFLNSLPADTPPEHIHAAVAAIRTFGRYPLAKDMDALEVKIPPRESFAEFVRRKQQDNPEGYTFSWLDEAHLKE